MGRAIPTVFHWSDRETIKPTHPKVLYHRWKEACKRAGVPERIPHDFRRTDVRNLERTGVPRSVAMKLSGYKTEAVYRRNAIVCEADLSERLRNLARLHDSVTKTGVSHTLATISDGKVQITLENMAEGARFELADELPHLRFSRPVRSAAPAPLHIALRETHPLFNFLARLMRADKQHT